MVSLNVVARGTLVHFLAAIPVRRRIFVMDQTAVGVEVVIWEGYQEQDVGD